MGDGIGLACTMILGFSVVDSVIVDAATAMAAAVVPFGSMKLVILGAVLLTTLFILCVCDKSIVNMKRAQMKIE